jgi:type I site-specific restriction endonuclease
MTPEQQARQKIDARLVASGWIVQDYSKTDLSAGRGIALREVPLKSGQCDYLLLVDGKPVGVLEAKKKRTLLSVVAEQSGFYAENLPDFLAAMLPGSLPFLYESTGVETFFRDERDPAPRSRQVFSFHRPETLAEWLAQCERHETSGVGRTTPPYAEQTRIVAVVYDMKFLGKWYDEATQQEKPLYGIFYVDDLRPKRERQMPLGE